MPSTTTVRRMGTVEMRTMARNMPARRIRRHMAWARETMRDILPCDPVHCARVLAVFRAELARRAEETSDATR